MPLLYQYLFAVSIALAITAFFVTLNFLVMKKRLNRSSEFFSQHQYKISLCDNSVALKGLYLGRPVEIKIVSYFRAPFSVVITCRGNFPVKEFHLYKDRKGALKYFQEQTKEFIPKEVIHPDQKSVIEAFYLKNTDLFSSILDCGITRISIYADRAILISNSSISTRKQKSLLKDTFKLKKVIHHIFSLLSH